MELELRYQTFEENRPVYHATWKHEETLESIVPDAMPDISRVISVSGSAFLKEKEVIDGSVRMSGTAVVNVLYIPEGEDFPRALVLSVPFRCSREDPRIKANTQTHGTISLSAADARVINPRKLLLRCDMMANTTVFETLKKDITCDIWTDQPDYVEKQDEILECQIVSEITEKVFQFSDVLKQPSSKPPIEEILCVRVEPGTLDGKIIGKKLVCKGDIRLTILYRSGSEILPGSFELPYSQVVELSQTFEEGMAELTFCLKAADIQLLDNGIEVFIEAILQGCIWIGKQVSIVKDTYSTIGDVSLERTEQKLCAGAEHLSSREQVRQFCESAIPARQILDCFVTAAEFSTEQSEKGRKCEAQFNIDILYISEDNSLCCIYGKTSSLVDIAVPSHANLQWNCRPIGEVSAVPVTGGAEVLFTAEFNWTISHDAEILNITAVEINEKPENRSHTPSVIVRISDRDDTLWAIAKSCRSTVRDICAVNGVSGDCVQAGTVLLIPTNRGN